jgi:tetratricopeptide (TPR) repeat protein
MGAMSLWQSKYAIPALIAIALVAYSNSFRTELTFDNQALILNDYRIEAVSAENAGLILTKDYWFNKYSSGLYRPLTTFTYLFNYAVLGNGADAEGYHWVNFLLHLANMALVYALGRLLLRDADLAVALAAIWGLHPVLTESVTNVVGRADLLAGFGLLAGLLCYTRSRKDGGIKWLAGLTIAAAIGIFSKESAAALLPVMIVYDLAYRKGVTWRRRAFGYAAAALPLLVYLIIRAQVGLQAMQTTVAENPLIALDFLTSRLIAVKVIGKYLALLAWPQYLSCDYSYNQVGGVDWRVWVALAVCLAAAAAAVVSYRKNRAAFFFILFFFVTLSPAANIVMRIGSIMAERFLYLPAIGFAGCVVLAARSAGRRLSHDAALEKWIPAALGVLAIALAGRTYARNSDWQDDASLARSTVEVCPASFKAHMLQARVLASSQGVDAGIREIEQSIAILQSLPENLQFSPVYVSAGSFYRQKGERLAPRDPGEAHFWYQKSLDTLLRAEKMQGLSFLTDLELGRTWMRLAQPAQAVPVFESGLRRGIQPALFIELGAAQRSLGQWRKAIAAILQAYIIRPGDKAIASQLLELYRTAAPQSCVAAQGLNLECPLYRADVCQAFFDLAAGYDHCGLADMVRWEQHQAAGLGCSPARSGQ